MGERGPAFNRLGVKDSLSASNSLIARAVILFEALAERIAAMGEFCKRIHLSFTAQASTAGAVRARKPATAPIPRANTGVYCRFIYSKTLSFLPRFLRHGRKKRAPCTYSGIRVPAVFCFVKWSREVETSYSRIVLCVDRSLPAHTNKS